MREGAKQRTGSTFWRKVDRWWLVVPSVITYGFLIAALLISRRETALPVIVCIPVALAWLRTSYASCAAAEAGQKLASSVQVEVFFASLLMLIPIFLSVCFGAVIGEAFGTEIQHNAIRFSEIDSTLAVMYALMFAAMMLSVWSPWLQANHVLIRRQPQANTLADSSSSQSDDVTSPSSNDRPPAVRFELRTVFVLITLLAIHLALGLTHINAIFALDYVLFVSWMAGADVLRNHSDPQTLKPIDRLAVYWEQFIAYGGAVVAAGFVAISARELVDGRIPWQSELCDHFIVPASFSVAVGSGLAAAMCWWLWFQRKASRGVSKRNAARPNDQSDIVEKATPDKST